MKKLSIFFLFFILFSCQQQEKNIRPTIKIVEDILLDKNSKEYTLLSSYSSLNPNSDIVLLSSALCCEQLSDYLLTYDAHDNVDGRKLKDELPDFAGESFTCVQTEGTESIDTLSIRHQAVIYSMASIDTLTHLSPYDIEGSKGKKRTKLLVVDDPYLVNYGLFDVDTLFKQSGCKVKLISSLDLSIAKVFENKENRPMNVAVFYNPEVSNSKPILDRFLSNAPSLRGTKYIAYSISCSDSLLHSAVKDLMEREICLDALVICDYSVDIDAIKIEYADMISVLNESSLIYSKYFAKDFQIIDTKELVAEFCFNFLRKDNLFTHTIAFPQVNFFKAVNNTQNGKILLIPNTYVQK